MSENKTITVTSPLLPKLEDFIPMLQDIWDRKWLTNNGHYHKELEKALADYLGVQYISLFTNGTLPLITALQALRISGEVITTPYSFVATTHSIWWNGLKPVFVDVDEETGNIDPEKIEAAITPHTTAIMPVHVYGTPCNMKRIQEIADIYGLKIIYDAAHAFGVKKDGESVLKAGDMSTLSFHATKVYKTGYEQDSSIVANMKGRNRVCYKDSTKYCDVCGGMYNWQAAMNLNGAAVNYDSASIAALIQKEHQGICPEGWHIPTMLEFKNIVVDKYGAPLDSNGHALRSRYGWGTNMEDAYGFSALPCGRHWYAWNISGYAFGDAGRQAYFLAYEGIRETEVRVQSSGFPKMMIYTQDHSADYHFSIRCVKND